MKKIIVVLLAICVVQTVPAVAQDWQEVVLLGGNYVECDLLREIVQEYGDRHIGKEIENPDVIYTIGEVIPPVAPACFSGSITDVTEYGSYTLYNGCNAEVSELKIGFDVIALAVKGEGIDISIFNKYEKSGPNIVGRLKPLTSYDTGLGSLLLAPEGEVYAIDIEYKDNIAKAEFQYKYTGATGLLIGIVCR